MPVTQPANTGIGNGGTGANTGAGGYSVTVSPNGQMTITQGGRPVYTGPVQGTSLTYNQSGQLVGFNAPKSSPITTTTQPSAPAQSSPAASPPTPRAGASGSSSSGGSGSGSSPTVTQAPAGTGPGQIPGWIYNQLNSGQIASWTNPNTGVTYWAPGAFGIINAHTIWQSGPTGSGPLGTVGNYTTVSYTHLTLPTIYSV